MTDQPQLPVEPESNPWKIASPDRGTRVAKRWFDELERILMREARLAGLYKHSTSIGDAREFFVRRLLKSILPPMVHVGRGRVIGAQSAPSKQIDVILYDPRFPVLETEPGMGLYLVEGVIAAIEIKSTLDRKSLCASLENCHSVKMILNNVNHGDLVRRSNELGPLLQTSDRIADPNIARWAGAALVLAYMSPRTYVFAFRSKLGAATVREIVQEWYEEAGEPGLRYDPYLPSMIIGGKVVGITNSADISTRYGDEVLSKIRAQHGDEASIAMELALSERRFGMLANHLINVTIHRLGPINFAQNVSYEPQFYLPWNEYLQGEWRRDEPSFVVRKQDYPVYVINDPD